MNRIPFRRSMIAVLTTVILTSAPAPSYAICPLLQCPLLRCLCPFRRAPAPVVVAPPVQCPPVQACPPVACQPVCQYVPQTAYRTECVQVPVTTYQATTTVDPCTCCPQTSYRPVTTYRVQARLVPYTTYRAVYTNVATTAYNGTAPGYAAPSYAAPSYSAPGYAPAQSSGCCGQTSTPAVPMADPATSGSSIMPSTPRPSLPPAGTTTHYSGDAGSTGRIESRRIITSPSEHQTSPRNPPAHGQQPAANGNTTTKPESGSQQDNESDDNSLHLNQPSNSSSHAVPNYSAPPEGSRTTQLPAGRVGPYTPVSWPARTARLPQVPQADVADGAQTHSTQVAPTTGTDTNGWRASTR